MNDLVIAQKVVQKEQFDLKDIYRRIEAVRRERDFARVMIQKEEGVMEELANEKVQLQTDEVERKRGRKQKLKEAICEAKRLKESLMLKEVDLKKKLPALESEVEQLPKTIQQTEDELKVCLNKIGTIGQQRSLSKQLKKLNLQDLRISKDANTEVRENLSKFIRNYQSIVDSSAP